ncbi:MAG: thiamine phosphate synthase [Deltaproteobacteria bacterium]|nr:thiamine phosphate synthase [Deltaproteobacteria bacterium]
MGRLEKIIRLYPVIDASFVKADAMEKTTLDIIRGGARVVQLRAKSVPSGEFLGYARTLRTLTSRRNVLFIVNDRADIALLSGADGVHLGQEDIPVDAVRRLLGKRRIIGLSTHTMKEARKAEEFFKEGSIDYISFGPVFPTDTKTDARRVVGLERLKDVKMSVTVPVVAIGGITGKNILKVVRTGADGAAVISGVLRAGDVEKKVKDLIGRLCHGQ